MWLLFDSLRSAFLSLVIYSFMSLLFVTASFLTRSTGVNMFKRTFKGELRCSVDETHTERQNDERRKNPRNKWNYEHGVSTAGLKQLGWNTRHNPRSGLVSTHRNKISICDQWKNTNTSVKTFFFLPDVLFYKPSKQKIRFFKWCFYLLKEQKRPTLTFNLCEKGVSPKPNRCLYFPLQRSGVCHNWWTVRHISVEDFLVCSPKLTQVLPVVLGSLLTSWMSHRCALSVTL